MDERTTTKLGIVCSLVGLIAIYAAAASARPRVTPISSLDNSFVGLRVAISGQVMDYREHKDGHLFLKLQDSSGGLVSVPIFSRTRAQIEDSIELFDIAEVTGEVLLYQGEFEVVPEGANDVRVVHTAPITLSNITEDNAGIAVKVQGTIAEREIVGNGNVILTLSEGGEQLPVFIPSWIVEDGLPEMHVGDTVRVDGWMQIYDGKLELKLADASHLHVVQAA